MSALRVFVGYDEREHRAAEVAIKSLRRVAPDLEPELLCAGKLADQGLLTRISDHRGGQDYCLVSNAPKSTRFAISRFLTPILCQQGFALFVDSDVVFDEDPRRMLTEVNAHHAVSVVKHSRYVPAREKMVDQLNVGYRRKNWSSVMLFNCDHAANRRLSLRDVNERRGLNLHQFYWLADDEIGELDSRWNQLVGEQPVTPGCGILHFTLGGPWLPGWQGAEHDDIWLEAAK
jgi:hypothetical protein